eukprot:comp25649_c0_seq1/m.47017 comp25649_c0_seq1/g.47017  ORF comp25649_c0_seq1/g.47017 comp25649_c0_seq1/m.47017 type:complete len:445 (-) comp25649_c0_seq1:708-2042(-)
MAKLLSRFGDKIENFGLDKSKRREREIEIPRLEETVPLHVAVKQGVDIVSVLINKGVDPNVRDSDGNTPLIVAVENDVVPVVSYLSSFAHVDLDMRNNNGETALHITVQNGKVAMTEQLKRMGANKEVADNNGKTPSHLVLDLTDRDLQVQLMTALNTPTSTQPRTEIANRRRSKSDHRKSLFRSESMDTFENSNAGYRDDRKRRKKKQDGDNISIKSTFTMRIGSKSADHDFDTQSVCSSRSEWDGVSLVSYDPNTKKPKWKKGIERFGEKAVGSLDRFSDKFRSSLRLRDKAESLQFGGDFGQEIGPPTIAVEEDQQSIGSRSIRGFVSPRLGGSPALKRSLSTRSKMAPQMASLESMAPPRFRLQVIHGVKHMVLQCEPTDTIEQIIEATQRLANVEVKGIKEAWATTVYGDKLDNHTPLKDQNIGLDDIVLVDSFSTFAL